MNLSFSQHLLKYLEEALALNDSVWRIIPGSYSSPMSPVGVNLGIVKFTEIAVPSISCSFTWAVRGEMTLYACQV